MKKTIVDLQDSQRTHLGESIEHLKAKISDTCEGCLWEGVCGGSLPCFDYSPMDNDIYIENYIETRRGEFGQDFADYINSEN